MNICLYYDAADETISFAANELRRYLLAARPDFSFLCNPDSSASNQAADCRALSISFLIDETHFSSTMDSYQITIQKDTGSIMGNNARSVLLGIYAYLRQLGYRFLMPQKTYIPETLSDSSLCLDYSHTSSLFHRGVCIEGSESVENVLDFIDWLPKAGYNSFFLQFKEPYIFLERWYDHVFNPLTPPALVDSDFYSSCYRQMDEAIQKRSLLYHAAGHGWTCEAIGEPSIGWVKTDRPPAEEIRPLLAEIDGKRIFMDDIPMNTNLCYSNKKAVELFCNSVLQYVEEHPHVDYLHIWLADETNHICECDNCRKESPTDQYIRMLNQIDREMTERGQDCKLVFLLYQELMYAPVLERIEHPERFVLMFAPISRTYKKSYPDHIHVVPLPEYRRNAMILPVSIDENLTYLRNWQDAFSGDGLIYDYPLGRAHYGDFGYVNITKTLCGDIKNIHALKLNGYLSCQELRAFSPNSLPNYAMGHLLNNTSEDPEALIDEYYQAAYGRDYQKVLDYLTQVSEYSDCDYFNKIGERIDPVVCARYQKLLTILEDFLPSIRSRLADPSCFPGRNGELHLFFWRLLEYHACYCIYLTKALIALSSGDTANSAIYFQEFCNYIRQHEADHQPDLDVYRIIEVATKYTGFKVV